MTVAIISAGFGSNAAREPLNRTWIVFAGIGENRPYAWSVAPSDLPVPSIAPRECVDDPDAYKAFDDEPRISALAIFGDCAELTLLRR